MAGMARRYFRVWGALTLCLGLVWAAPAQQEDRANDKPLQKSDKEGKRPQAKASVGKALKSLDTFNAVPNTKAKFYIYLFSAGWCPSCKAEMPDFVKLYPEMKKKKVEMILIGADHTREAAIKYLESVKAEFPGVHYKSDGVRSLPGLTPPQAMPIPYAILVDDKGRVLCDGSAGSVIRNWEKNIKAKPAKKS